MSSGMLANVPRAIAKQRCIAVAVFDALYMLLGKIAEMHSGVVSKSFYNFRMPLSCGRYRIDFLVQ